MKRIAIPSLLLAVALTSACNSFLDKEPLDMFTDENFWESENTVASYANSFYEQFAGYGNGNSYGDFYFKTLSDDQAGGYSFADWTFTNVPAIATARQAFENYKLELAYSTYNLSDARIAKGDFIRMKELSLGYELPQKLVSTIGLRNASVKLQGTNLFLIYADKKLNGQDPEFFNTGGVAVPMAKQFTLTLKLGL